MNEKDNFEFSAHALEMLKERRIDFKLALTTIQSPDIVNIESDGNTHFIKYFQEFGNRALRVVINKNVEPNKVVTLFFDRRLRKR